MAPRHAAFEERDAGVLVRPLDTAASLRVNGDTVDGERLLADGDTVEAGTVRIRYRARIHPLILGLPMLAGAVLVAAVAGGAGYGIWTFIRQRAGLDRVDPPVAVPPAAVVAAAPTLREPPDLATMERIGQSPRPVMSAASTSGAPPVTVIPALSEPALSAPRPRPPPVSSGTTQGPPVLVATPPATATTQAATAAVKPEIAKPAAATNTPVATPPAAALVRPETVRPPVPPPPPPPVPSQVPPPIVIVPPSTTPAPPAAVAMPQPPPGAPPLTMPSVTTAPATNTPPAPSGALIALAQAEALLRAGSLDAASEKAALAVDDDPRLMPARALQARIADRRGRLEEAERLWTLVLQNSAGAPLYDEAFKELVRIAELQIDKAPPPLTAARTSAPPARVEPPAPAPPPPAVVTTSAPILRVPPEMASLVPSGPGPQTAEPSPPTPAPAVAPAPATPRPPVQPPVRPAPPPERAPAPQRAVPEPARPKPAPAPAATALSVRITGAEVTRFPPPADQQDFRVLEVALSAAADGAAFPSDRVSVEVVFYDRSEPPGHVFPSRDVPSRGRIALSQGLWKPGETKSVVVPYAVAKPADAEVHSRYHGFRVRVYADGRLVDEQAKPSGLR